MEAAEYVLRSGTPRKCSRSQIVTLNEVDGDSQLLSGAISLMKAPASRIERFMSSTKASISTLAELIAAQGRASDRGYAACRSLFTAKVMRSDFCKLLMIANRLSAVGFPRGPSIRCRLLVGMPVALARRSKVTVALM